LAPFPSVCQVRGRLIFTYRYENFSSFDWKCIKTILWAAINEDPTQSLNECVTFLAEERLDVSKVRKVR
jgi:hypothetical protein